MGSSNDKIVSLRYVGACEKYKGTRNQKKKMFSIMWVTWRLEVITVDTDELTEIVVLL